MFRPKQTTRSLAALAAPLLVGVALSSAPASAQVWQATADFSTVQGDHNWRYMTFAPTDSTYKSMLYGTNYFGFSSWYGLDELGNIANPFIRSGDMRPGTDYGVARVWESPLAGTVRVTGTVMECDTSPRVPGYPVDGVRATIWKNGELLYLVDLADSDFVGYSYDLSVHVRPGDWLIFRVDGNSNPDWDGTCYDPRIVVQSLETAALTHDLAADWSIAANPNGAWTYGLMDASHAFYPFTSTTDAALLGDFVGEQPAWDGGYPMVLGKSTDTCIHDFPLNRVGGHTSNDDATSMAVRWTAPTAGTYDISGGTWMFREIGREALVSLYVNGTALFDDVLIPARSAGYNSGATFTLGAAMLADGRSPSALSEIPLVAGDTVTLAVRKTVDSDFGDYVGIDLSLTSDTGSWIADVLNEYSAYVAGLDPSLFPGPTTPARISRRLSLSHELQVASNRASSGHTNAALQALGHTIWRLDGDSSPPDWMAESPQKQALREDVSTLFILLRGF
jgi:hypothetical protein